MKTRLGFVTNSSSSSFIIAKKSENVDEKAIASFIHQNGMVADLLDCFKYLDWPEDIQSAYDNGNPKIDEMIARYIANELLVVSPDMTLDGWKVTAGEASNETSDPLYFFLHSADEIDLPNFKTTSVCI